MKVLEKKPRILYVDNPRGEVHDQEAWAKLNKYFEVVHCNVDTADDYLKAMQDPNDNGSDEGAIDGICRSVWMKDLPVFHRSFLSGETVRKLPKSVKIITQGGHGFDRIDLNYLTERKIFFCNSPDCCSISTADVGVSLILQSFRYLTFVENCLRNQDWQKATQVGYIAENPNGKTLGIIGLGNIGFRVAQVASALGMKILYNGRSRKEQYEKQIPGMKYYPELNDMLAESDCVFVVCPYTPETHHLIDRERFKYMKDKVRLVNIGRGATVEEDAVIDALERGQLIGAGFDVHEFEPKVSPKLLENYKVTLYPHTGAASADSLKAFEAKCVDNLLRYFYGLGDGKPECVNTELLKTL